METVINVIIVLGALVWSVLLIWAVTVAVRLPGILESMKTQQHREHQELVNVVKLSTKGLVAELKRGHERQEGLLESLVDG